MASALVDAKLCFSIPAVLLVFAFCCSSGTAEGGGDYGPGISGFGHVDPAQIVARALLCFNDKYVSRITSMHPLINKGKKKEVLTFFFFSYEQAEARNLRKNKLYAFLCPTSVNNFLWTLFDCLNIQPNYVFK